VLREFLPDAAPGKIQKAFDALTFFDDPDKLEDWAQKRLGLSAEDAKKFVKIRPPEGRASYSLHAIRKILPFLRDGYEQSEAVFYAKLPEALRDFNEREDTFIAELRQISEDYRKDMKQADPSGCGLTRSRCHRLMNAASVV
jgi:CRISPR-associated endonuclease Csn1